MGRIVIYTTLLLILIAGAAYLAALTVARRRRSLAVQDDEFDGPARDIPLLFQPRAAVEFVPRQQRVDVEDGFRPPSAAPASQPSTGASEIAPISPETGGTMQLLPGRLEPVSDSIQQEIRFVRMPGVNRFTFGRSPGPLYAHVQLRAATASRMHAYMLFENGRWRIGNLSETNEVLVNGKRINSDQADRLLEDGDQIELGELAFVFRAR